MAPGPFRGVPAFDPFQGDRLFLRFGPFAVSDACCLLAAGPDHYLCIMSSFRREQYASHAGKDCIIVIA
jgi:hypothetical protein